MLLGQIYQSVSSWQKLAAINMKPKLAYKILKYVKLVFAEQEIIEKQRVALIREITGTKDGEDAKIEPNTPEFIQYMNRFNEVLVTEATLAQCDSYFDEVMDAVDEKNESLTVTDLAMLEPFFNSPDLRKIRES